MVPRSSTTTMQAGPFPATCLPTLSPFRGDEGHLSRLSVPCLEGLLSHFVYMSILYIARRGDAEVLHIFQGKDRCREPL